MYTYVQACSLPKWFLSTTSNTSQPFPYIGKALRLSIEFPNGLTLFGQHIVRLYCCKYYNAAWRFFLYFPHPRILFDIYFVIIFIKKGGNFNWLSWVLVFCHAKKLLQNKRLIIRLYCDH